MKFNESKLRRCGAALLRQSHAAWKILGRCVRRRPVGGGVMPNDLPGEHSDPRMNPLDRIKLYLSDVGLSRQVDVRFDHDADDFVLEDMDGSVHAKDYDRAVATIQRIWL